IAASISSGGASLSRKPLAPARIAASTYSSRSKVVRTITRGSSPAAVRRSVAPIPSMRGMRMSMRTTSTSPARAAGRIASSASWPSSDSITASRSGWESITMRKPARTSFWSSTRAMRITGNLQVRAAAAWHGPGARRRGAARSCRWGQRQRGTDPEPAAGARADRECATEHHRAFAHPEQSVPADGVLVAQVCCGAAPVVGDLEGQRGVGPLYEERHGRVGPRVLHDVGEGLLADAVRREPDPGWEGTRCAHPYERHVEPARAHLLDERLEVPRTGLGGERAVVARLAVVLAQHPEEAAHVGERGAARLGDRLEREGRGGGVLRARVPAAVGLGDHDGEGVGD